MNAITITDLIPSTEENDEVLVVIYKGIKDYAQVTSGEKTIKFIKKMYPYSWKLHCKNIYLLEGKSKKLYQSLIVAGELNTQNGVEIYLNNYFGKTNTWWLITLDIILFPLYLLFLPIILMIVNKVLNSDLTLKQL